MSLTWILQVNQSIIILSQFKNKQKKPPKKIILYIATWKIIQDSDL